MMNIQICEEEILKAVKFQCKKWSSVYDNIIIKIDKKTILSIAKTLPLLFSRKWDWRILWYKETNLCHNLELVIKNNCQFGLSVLHYMWMWL